MTLADQIQQDLRQAMKGKEAVRLVALRMLLAAIKNREIEERHALADDVVLKVVSTLIKQREESIALYRQGGREELAAKEEAEIVYLRAYLPQQMSSTELEHMIDAAIAETGATSNRDMGKVMKIVVPKIAGRADGKIVSDLVRKKLP